MFLSIGEGLFLDPSWIFSNWFTGLVVHRWVPQFQEGSKIDPFLVDTAHRQISEMYWKSTLYPRVSLLDKKKDITILLKN
jgi:hypothetical protein